MLVARALASEPEILVLDEPTTGMDLPVGARDAAPGALVHRSAASPSCSSRISSARSPITSSELVVVAGLEHPVAVGPRAELLTSERLSRIYERPIAVRTVEGHSVIYVEDGKP